MKYLHPYNTAGQAYSLILDAIYDTETAITAQNTPTTDAASLGIARQRLRAAASALVTARTILRNVGQRKPPAH